MDLEPRVTPEPGTTDSPAPLPLRWLVDPPARGSWNMAADEVLLENAGSRGEASLRIYFWERATLSLGYFQAAADRARHAASSDCPLVRRASGGGAIVHDRELTYSLAVPSRMGQRGEASDLYAAAHQALVQVLAQGRVRIRESLELWDGPLTVDPQPFLCFQRRSAGDGVLVGHKVLGSAQRRRHGALLQHGSLLLASSQAAPELPGLSELSDWRGDVESLWREWSQRLAASLGRVLVESAWTSEEITRAKLLEGTQFAADAWTLRR